MAKNQVLTHRQRQALMRFPLSTEGRLIACHYILSSEDLLVIQRQRTPITRLTLALHLCILRHPGRVWKMKETLPDYLIQLVADQLDLSPQYLHQYQHEPALRREQLRTIRQYFGFRLFNNSTKDLLRAWLLPSALSTDKASVLMNILIEKMRYEKIVIPALSSLETFVHQIMKEAEAENVHRLVSHLSDGQKQRLDNLISKQSETTSYLTWLQHPPGATTAKNFLTLLDRLSFVRLISLDSSRHYSVNSNRISQLSRQAQRLSAWQLRRLSDDQRYAILVALVLHHTGVLIDQALEMFLLLYHQVFSRARNAQPKRFYQDRKHINQHLRDYVTVGQALIAAHNQQDDPFEALEQVMAWEDFVARITEAEKLIRPQNFDFLELVGNRYSYIRRFTPAILKSFSFQGHDKTLPLRQGLQLLHEVDEGTRPALPDWTPVDFVDGR